MPDKHNLFKRLFRQHRRWTFTFVLEDHSENTCERSADDVVGPDLLRELGVFIVQERVDVTDRILVLDTDNNITSDQVLSIFRRHGFSAHLLNFEESKS